MNTTTPPPPICCRCDIFCQCTLFPVSYPGMHRQGGSFLVPGSLCAPSPFSGWYNREFVHTHLHWAICVHIHLLSGLYKREFLRKNDCTHKFPAVPTGPHFLVGSTSPPPQALERSTSPLSVQTRWPLNKVVPNKVHTASGCILHGQSHGSRFPKPSSKPSQS